VDDWLLLGLAHQRLGHAAEAAQWLAKALDAWPDGGLIHNRKMHLHDRLAGELLRREADALLKSTDGPAAHNYAGLALRAKPDLDGAVAEFRKATKLDPEFAPAYYNLGCALDEQGKLHEAIAEYRKAIDLDPKCVDAYVNLGVSHAQLGRWKEAAAAFDRALELDPTDHERWCQASALHLGAGDLESYRRVCYQLVKRFGDTDDPVIAERTAKACLMLPDTLSAAEFDRVQKLAERAVTTTEGHPFYQGFIFAKGLADYRAGRHADAVKWLERFAPNADGGPFDASAFAVLAMAQHQRPGRTEEAAAALAKAKGITAKMPDPARGQLWHFWVHGQSLYREAEQLLKKDSDKE
jgi:tetratricopeptide (TPR) repeat protein